MIRPLLAAAALLAFGGAVALAAPASSPASAACSAAPGTGWAAGLGAAYR
jgi:hypothetical protein